MKNLCRRIPGRVWTAAIRLQPLSTAATRTQPEDAPLLSGVFRPPGHEQEAAKKRRQGKHSQNLYSRLSALGIKKNMVSTTINEYIREGKTPLKAELYRCIKELRKYKKPHLALEIIDWMDTKGLNKSVRDFPVHLDLIAKVKGIEEAEKYFKGMSTSGRNAYTYGALLNCYCTSLMEDQALALFEEMRDKNLAFTSVAYGNLMTLYMRSGQPEKVAPLVEDMKKRNIELSTFTYCIWMKSCLHLDDVEGAEKVFEEVKQDSSKKCDWTIYSNLAVVYVKTGHKEKAELALKKFEQLMNPRDHGAYHYLISLYAGVSNLNEVYRVWKSLKQRFEVVTNISYLVMLQALGKLDHLVGMKDCFEEWELICRSYDTRLAHSVIKNYLRHHMVEEAECVFYRAKERSSRYPFWISETLMVYYLKNNEKQQALHFVKEIVSRVKDNECHVQPEWHLQDDTIEEFLRYFGGIEDVDLCEEFCKLLEKVDSLKYESYKSLFKTYIVSGGKTCNMQEGIKEVE